MIEATLRKIEQVVEVADDLMEALRSLFSSRAAFSAGQTVVHAGDQPSVSLVLLEGFSARVVESPEGRRQMVAMGVAGDWVDIQSYFVRTMDHSLIALTDLTVATIPHVRVKQLIERFPIMTTVLWRDVTVEMAITRQWAFSAGARGARRGMAHLFCELHERLNVVGLADDQAFDLPLTQGQMAEALGITAVHANRVLRRLRDARLVDWDHGHARIRDWEQLAAVAEFDPTYLHINEGPAI